MVSTGPPGGIRENRGLSTGVRSFHQVWKLSATSGGLSRRVHGGDEVEGMRRRMGGGMESVPTLGEGERGKQEEGRRKIGWK